MTSLKSRLALWIVLPTLLAGAADLIVSYRNADQVATLVQQQLLKGSARIIAEQLTAFEGGYDISIPPAAFELFATPYRDRVFYAVRTAQGTLISGTDELAPYAGPLRSEHEAYYLASLRGEPVRVIAYKHVLPNTAGDYAITQVAQTLHSHAAFQRDLFRQTMRQHLTMLSIVLAGLAIAMRWILKPVRRFGEQMAGRRPGAIETLDETAAPRELAPVVRAMNDYAARLDHTLAAYEQFIANTAHYLRTSFAILTSQVNFGMRSSGLTAEQKELLNAIQKAVQQGNRVINQLLVLASIEKNGAQDARQLAETSVHLADLITSVLEELAPLAQQKQVDLGVGALDAQLTVSAPPMLMRELLSNLVENAIQHMGGAGAVTVSLQRQGVLGLLSVIDTGPGIPPSERQKVFERFYRLDKSKPDSSGLGLAIVQEICQVLHANISLRTPDNGRGLQADVMFLVQQDGNPAPLPHSEPVSGSIEMR